MEFVNSNQLFKRPDVLSIRAPLNEENHHVIIKRTIEMMKTGVWIINTSRGDLINENAHAMD